MRRVFDLVTALGDARPLDLFWDGIGEWRASTPPADLGQAPAPRSAVAGEILRATIEMAGSSVQVEFFDAAFCTGEQNEDMTGNLDLSMRFSVPVLIQAVQKNLIVELPWKTDAKKFGVIGDGAIAGGIVVTMVADWGRDDPRQQTPPVQAPPWADVLWLEQSREEALGRLTVRAVP
jgi:hypothetical protein